MNWQVLFRLPSGHQSVKRMLIYWILTGALDRGQSACHAVNAPERGIPWDQVGMKGSEGCAMTTHEWNVMVDGLERLEAPCLDLAGNLCFSDIAGEGVIYRLRHNGQLETIVKGGS